MSTVAQTDPRAEAGDAGMSGEELKQLGARLQDLLRLRTLPIGMKLYESVEEMKAIPGLRLPQEGMGFTSCQLVTRARYSGQTLGFVEDHLRPHSNCGGVLGLNKPSEAYLSGERMDGVWFENREAAHQHQLQMPRVPHGRYKGVAVSPLRSGRIGNPDIVLFYGTPGQMIIFINGLQWKTYERYTFSVTGESACADSWGTALSTGKTSLSIPCFAERRYGGVSDDEMLMALQPKELKRAIEGMEGISRAGLRYPIIPYGPNADPTPGMDFNYGKKPL